MQVELCRHIKSNGIQCHAVALRDEHFCYFHKRLNEGHRLYRSTMAGKKRLMDRGFIIALPPLEDRVSVQLALSEVINALACNFIDSKRANALFFGLKLAAANAKGLEAFPGPPAVVRDYSLAPDLLESIAVDLAPAGRTCEIDEPAPIDPAFADDPIESPASVQLAPASPPPAIPTPEAPLEEADDPFAQEFQLEMQALVAEARARMAESEAKAEAAPDPAIPTPEAPQTVAGEPYDHDRELEALFAAAQSPQRAEESGDEHCSELLWVQGVSTIDETLRVNLPLPTGLLTPKIELR